MSGVTLRRTQPTNKKPAHSLPFFNNASATTTRRSHQQQQSSRLFRKRHGCDPIKLLILSVVSLCLLMQGGALHWLQQQRLANQARLRIHPFNPQSLPSWLTNYVRWHQSRLHYNPQTGEYEFHVSKDDDDYGYGYFQYVCHAEHICGGVGDRIKSALTTLYFSICTNRSFFMDIDSPSNIQHFLQPNLLYWNATIVHHDESPTDTQRRHQRHNTSTFWHLDLMNASDHVILQDPNRAARNFPPAVQVRLNRWMPRKIQQSPCMQQLLRADVHNKDVLFHQLYRTLFQFTDKTIQRANELKAHAGMKSVLTQEQVARGDVDPTIAEASLNTRNQLPNNHNNNNHNSPALPYVAVHIRTGDAFVGYNKTRHNDADTVSRFYQCAQKFQTALQQCWSSSSETNIKPIIYVASDSVATKNDFVAQDPSSIRQVQPSEQVFHVDLSARQHVISDEAKQRLELDVWAELKILTDATCLVYSFSGYSRIANAAGLRPRCAVRFDECHSQRVAHLLKEIGCGRYAPR